MPILSITSNRFIIAVSVPVLTFAGVEVLQISPSGVSALACAGLHIAQFDWTG